MKKKTAPKPMKKHPPKASKLKRVRDADFSQ